MQPVSRICNKRLCRAERYSFRPAPALLRFAVPHRVQAADVGCGTVSCAGRYCVVSGGRRNPGKGLAGAAGFRQNPLQRCGRSPVRPKAGALPSGRTGGGSVRRRSGGVRTFGSGGRGANGRYFPAWRCGYTSFCINFAGLQQREYRYGDIVCRQLRLVHLQSGAHAP